MNDKTTQLLFPFMGRIYDFGSRISWPLVRIITGFNLIPHGGAKLFGWFGGDASRTAGYFSQLGLEPALPLVYLVGCTEFFGGILLIIGLLTRPAAAMAAGFLAVSTFYVHLGDGFFWHKGGYEYPLMWLVLSLVIFFRGGGPFSLDARIGREI